MTDTITTKMTEFKQRLADVTHLRSALYILEWDQQVNMPIKGTQLRATTTSTLSRLLHEHYLALNENNLITDLKKALDQNEISGDDAIIVQEVWRDFEKQQKLPVEFVSELSQLSSEMLAAWTKARKDNDFVAYAPSLEKMVALNKREAEYIGYTGSPYNALLDSYEPGLTTDELDTIFAELKAFLIPFIAQLEHLLGKPSR